MTETYHIPALLHETIDGLNISQNGIYVDVTFGGGGHSKAILNLLSEEGKLFSFDQDIDAYNNFTANNSETPENWEFVHSNFKYLKNFMQYYGVNEIDGLVADLGVSFHHFDTAKRGFSFRFMGPLDMRMNQKSLITAQQVINTYSEQELARVLHLYGEMNNSRQIARKIVKARENEIITTTKRLVEVVIGSKVESKEDELDIDARYKKDLARLFQALRIEVNDEMGALRSMLTDALELLRPKGRIAVLTYHSLEDRIVKNFFRTGNFEGKQEKDFYGNLISPFMLVNNKVIVASEEEVEQNPRARSAKLRIAEKK
ncbi:MAG: 16S rRNA (cytosine(1402)-N(4))-methyltransferase RsmH [Paludibacteraceae bacterium]|nr:16S rRNA (cytosine(1402)-N(4))-methyltransferase RsmH [Paludibacteraceae bacterium]